VSSPGNPTATPALLRGVDRAALATSLGLRLRAAGVDVGLTAVETFTRALEVMPPDRRTTLYWAARLSLVRRRPDLEVFDAVFAAVFDDAVLSLDPHARRARQRVDGPPTADDRLVPVAGSHAEDEVGQGLPWVRLPTVVGADQHDDDSVTVPERLPSTLEGVADVPFAELDQKDLGLLETWLREALRDWPAHGGPVSTPSTSSTAGRCTSRAAC